MNIKLISLFFSVLLIGTVATAEKKSGEITGAHAEAGLECANCHATDEPVKNAPQSSCIECHGDRSDETSMVLKETNGLEFTVSPHNSHAGQIRCTLCHKAHKESVLYCNETCHHKFILRVP
jgi:fumarate reductase flavoprotein subunit